MGWYCGVELLLAVKIYIVPLLWHTSGYNGFAIDRGSKVYIQIVIECMT